MKEGDLVKWHTDAWVFKHASERYCNPGIILKVLEEAAVVPAYQVMWADGKVTNEHSGYLIDVGSHEGR